MVNEEKNILNFGSEELNKELEYEGGDFMKFALGQPVNIEVLTEKGVVKQIKEFEPGKQTVRFDLNIKVDDKEKVWSVSRKVLNTINEYEDQTKKFKIVRKDMSYDVIPLGIKE